MLLTVNYFFNSGHYDSCKEKYEKNIAQQKRTTGIEEAFKTGKKRTKEMRPIVASCSKVVVLDEEYDSDVDIDDQVGPM